jgi:NosR/NirI family nitrous oxide reductase transcriptional regulator
VTPVILEMLSPGAEKVGEVGGVPTSATADQGDRQVGYLFSAWDATQSKGFSNQPLIVLVGLDLAGRITGARVVHHREPIAILGLHDEDFDWLTENYKGLDISSGVDVVISCPPPSWARAAFPSAPPPERRMQPR